MKSRLRSNYSYYRILIVEDIQLIVNRALHSESYGVVSSLDQKVLEREKRERYRKEKGICVRCWDHNITPFLR